MRTALRGRGDFARDDPDAMLAPADSSLHRTPARAGQGVRARLALLVRAWPIRWRILAIAVLNSAVALILLALIWDSARVVERAWTELEHARQSERLLVSVDSEAGRLQSLIHRYFNQPDPDVLAEIVQRQEPLISQLRVQARLNPLIAQPARALTDIIERFLAGFDELRTLRTDITHTYEVDVLRPARDMAGLYAIIEGAVQTPGSPLMPPLGKSREALNATLLAANAYYLSISQAAGDEAKRHVELIERTAPVMLDLAENDLQRQALQTLLKQAGLLRAGLDRLTEQFATQRRLLREEIDANATAMTRVTDDLAAMIRRHERAANERFDRALNDVAAKVAIIALGFVLLVILMGIGIAKSISDPLNHLRTAMLAIVAGDDQRRVKGLDARDEIGEMARAVEVFRENAIAKRRAEEALRAAKERAETALADLRETQESLIEAEKLAALGGLVAGVAHEVNNPVGISLTVASSLAQRCEAFGAEVESGPIRRSRLAEFVAGARDAAGQLVANLHRAGDLIQSFKQVAVDRSHAERRTFDLREATDQIVASLRPGLKNARVRLAVDVPEGIAMDSYPGPFGQVLTNLVLNAVTHGFSDGATGTISLDARRSGPDHVEILFRDDGRGMAEEVQRQAFDPFFTTRRGEGGTGLGLHIVYNLVTRRLGGRIVLSSQPGTGTTFRIALPLAAPKDEG
jgi:signal transduction histidine kinase